MTSTRDLAIAHVLHLRQQAAAIDLANDGRRRSTHVLAEFFHELMPLAAPDLFVEAGAFDAAASRRTARSLPHTRVVAFEANPDNYRIWTKQVAFTDEGIDYRHAALTDEAGRVTFYLRSRGHDVEEFEDNSIIPRHVAASDLEFDTVDVVGTTLDGEFATDQRPAIWIDVEGATREVITGGADFFDRCVLAMIEVEDDPLWEGQWLTTDVVEAVLAHGMVPLARDAQFSGQHNIVFVSRGWPRILASSRRTWRFSSANVSGSSPACWDDGDATSECGWSRDVCAIRCDRRVLATMSEPVGSPPDRARRETAHDPGVTLARLYSEQLRVTAARISSELGGPSKSAERLDRLFRGLVAQAAPGWFLEVGAYAAETSRWAATELIDCHVVALEASRDAHERLVRRYDFASLGVDYRHAAAASHDGEIELILDGTSAYRGVSLLERRDVHQPRTVTVPSVRLDSVVTDTTANVALWIDVEGASGQVLAGAPRVLSQTDVLKIEVEDAPIWHGQMVTVEVIAQLLGHGLVPVARDIEYGTQYNILALSERLLRTPGVPEQVDAFHYDNAHRWSREPNRLRRSNLRLLGRWARRLRG